MIRIDKVYEGLCRFGSEQGITAGDLALKLNLSRSNCSYDLNRLCEEGRACKNGSKPVYYSPSKEEKQAENPFTAFIRHNPSLSKCGDLAKAAVLYPPNGMNMLLLGETGVGKSMFAEMIYDFACSLGRIAIPDSFVAFNCADYTNNPQLLLSQLFGAVKGAYTGADRDRKGLFEAADGGILFLDEVHRLPAEGQEMLFTYMDRGVFRRLGETAFERGANVMLICATTENPNSALLQTFLRRLAVIIQIPGLAERSLEERQNLVALFFSRESTRVEKPIQVSINSLRALLGYHCPGNVGQLAGDIRLLCAKAYANYISGNSEQIRITSFSLPPHIRNGFLNEKSRRELWNRFGTGQKRFFHFNPDGTLPDFEEGGHVDIYEMMERQTQDMKRVGIPEENIQAEVNNLLERYYQQLGTGEKDKAALERLVGPEIVATTEKMLSIAQNITGREFTDNIRFALPMHIFNTLKYTRENRKIEHSEPDNLKNQYPVEWNAALACLQILENDFGIKMPVEEAAFLTLFFSPDTFASIERPSVQLIVAAHGIGTASGMADAANHLLGIDLVMPFDMSMKESPEQAYQRVKQFIQDHPDIREILFLVDMGSLVNFAHDLEQEFPLKTRTIMLVSTLHVMEAARKAALGHTLDEIYDSIIKVRNIILGETDEISIPSKPKLFLLTVCTTGEGGADMLKQILEKHLDLENCSCQIIAAAITNRLQFDKQINELENQGRIAAVVSAFETGLPVPHISISAILDNSGIPSLQKRLNWESLRFRLVNTIADMLDQLDAAAAIESTHDMLSKLVFDLNADLPEEMMVGILSHLLFMLNRLKKGESAPIYPNKEVLHRKYPGVVGQVERASRSLGRRFGVEIPDDEVYYIAAFFTKEKLFRTPATWG